MLEAFGRGCLYIIIGIAVLFFLAMLTQSHINIPIFLVIPLVILAFWVANRKSN
ncbi:hypothetical protein [Virgibacillus litoralis]|uniref:hypothetical protein n=1 Tax=Virgibacillus litoralis TaxID=578221 RepID=UPI001AE40FC6|nr:hypothetical protein [Virgibacillus litoralis]